MTEEKSEGNSRSCYKQLWIGWIKFCRKVNNFIDSCFEVHTRFIASHNTAVIITTILFVLLMAAGIVWLTPLRRNEELFIPQGSQAFKDLDKADQLFPEKYRVEEAILKRMDKQNIFNDSKIFQTALQLHQKIIQLENYGNTCLQVTNPLNGNSSCLFLSPLQVFEYSHGKINNISETFKTWWQNQNMMFSNGRPAVVNYVNILGNYKASDDGKDVKYADAIRLVYYMTYVDTTDDMYKPIQEFEQEFIDLCALMKDVYKKENIELTYHTARTRDDAIRESTVGDLPLFSVAFILMIGFCLFVFLRIKNPVTGHVTVGILGVIVVVCGVICGFGLAMWFRTKFVAFTGIILFLILGIGMDNMFIIIDAIESVDPMIKGKERLVLAMKHVGGSITMTTVTDLVAFAVSTSSSFPSVHLFCIYASLSIFFGYVMLNTLFLALLTWDIHRIERGQRDVGPCCCPINIEKLGNPWDKENVENLSKKILTKWARLLMTTPMKIFVFILACGLLAASIYGTTRISQKLDWKKVGRDGSYFLDFVEARDSSFPAGYSVSVILPDTVDYTNNNTIQYIIDLDDIAISNPRYENYTINWVKAYKAWSQVNNISITGENFYRNIKQFLRTNQIYRPDIKFHKDQQTIKGSRVIFFYENSSDSDRQADAMKSIREDVDKKSRIAGAFPVSIMFIYTEMFAAIKGDTINNLIICAIAILVITLPYLMHPGITMLVFLSFVSLVVELIGMMAAWNVSLDSVAMLTIIMAIGFSVDYTCHVAHAFTISLKSTPEERIVEALSTMGSSVLNGGISTFLGMLVTAFSKAQVFRIFFKMIFGIVVLGLIHGLVFLPVLLSIFARHDLRDDMKSFRTNEVEGTKEANDQNKQYGGVQQQKQCVQYQPENYVDNSGVESIRKSSPIILHIVPESSKIRKSTFDLGITNSGYEK